MSLYIPGNAEIALTSTTGGVAPDSETQHLDSKRPAETKQDLVKQVTQMIRNLVALSQTLDALPSNRWLTMKL
jgi:hypothetical protein